MLKKILKSLLKLTPQKDNINKVFIDGVIIKGKYENLKIGERVSFGGNVFIMANSMIEIGDDSMIAYGTKIITSTHDYDNNPMWQQRIDRPIRIGKNVWIGTNTIIMPGIVIGNNVVVGAGSIVTKHISDNMIVAGVPAKFVKYRNTENYDSSIEYPGVIVKENFLPQKNKIQN